MLILMGIGLPACRSAMRVDPVLEPSIKGCEYKFDKDGVRGTFWMDGPPRKWLWIHTCFDERGSKVNI